MGSKLPFARQTIPNSNQITNTQLRNAVFLATHDHEPFAIKSESLFLFRYHVAFIDNQSGNNHCAIWQVFKTKASASLQVDDCYPLFESSERRWRAAIEFREYGIKTSHAAKARLEGDLCNRQRRCV